MSAHVQMHLGLVYTKGESRGENRVMQCVTGTFAPLEQQFLSGSLFWQALCTKAVCACSELAHWHTNRRDVVCYGLLTARCLRTDRAPVNSPSRTSNWELQKMSFLGPGCCQGAEEQHPPKPCKEWNARLWSATPGITSGSYTKITTWREDASIYWDMVALQIPKIWIFLIVMCFTPGRKASQKSGGKNLALIFTMYCLKYSWDFCLCFVDTFLSVTVFFWVHHHVVLFHLPHFIQPSAAF